MLDTLFSDELSSEKKKQILETEHQMQMTRQLQGGINHMCNVSQGIKEKAFAQGISQGEKNMLIRLIKKKLSKNMSLEAISADLEVDIETIASIISEM